MAVNDGQTPKTPSTGSAGLPNGNQAIPVPPQMKAQMQQQISGQQPQGTPAPQAPAGSQEPSDSGADGQNYDYDSLFGNEDQQVDQDNGSGQSSGNGEDELSQLDAIAGVEPETPAQPQPQQAQPQPQAGQPPIDMEKARGEALKHLESTLYNLDDETRKKLVTEPDQVIPQLAAQLHLNVMEQVFKTVQPLVQNLLGAQLQQRDAAQKAERAFFQRYPALEKYPQDVMKALTTIKQMNPNATPDQIISEGAALAAFNIQQRLRRQGQQPNQQQQQGRPAPQQPQRRAPYSPAGATGRAAPQQMGGGDPQAEFWAAFAMDNDW